MTGVAAYRLAVRVLFAPFGGVTALRRRVVETLALREGARVLELGCGPGDLTAMLLERRALVHAVDSSAAMLRAAARRAPRAQYVHADIRSYRPTTHFDAAVLVFVLHEVAADAIPAILGTVAAALAPGGQLVIVDHAVPRGMRGRVWRRVLYAVESRTVDSWLALDVASLARAAGLRVDLEADLLGGRARLVAARRL